MWYTRLKTGGKGKKTVRIPGKYGDRNEGKLFWNIKYDSAIIHLILSTN